MIRGYPAQPSPRAGGTVVLHVSTDAPEFRIELFRCGAAMTPLSTSGWLPGTDAPLHLPFQDCGLPGVDLTGRALAAWPAYEVSVPEDWPSGVYVAVLVEGDGSGRARSQPDTSTPDGRDARVLFVVRPAPHRTAPGRSADLLVKLPLLTYLAYAVGDGRLYDPATATGQWCFYNPPEPSQVPRPVPPSLSLHRPGGGTGAVPYDIGNWDPFDPTPRQTYVHWDARLVGWLEREGYRAEFCTDVDLHREGADLLAPYRLLVSAGHDEYWTDAMRDAVEAHVAGGRNAAFFSGNTAWWRVVFDDETTFRRVHHWWEPGPDGRVRPENTLLGVSFRNGGERDRDEHPEPVGFRVQHADSWVYEGTGLRNGDVLGGAREDYLVGYECDGAHFDRADFSPDDLAAGRPVRPSGADGTPRDFTILGVGDLAGRGWGFGNGAATMGLHSPGGTVFTASTTDWVRVLTDGRSPAVERITRNVLDRLGGRR